VDKFGRLLARVEPSDGRDLARVLIQEHLAKPYHESQGVLVAIAVLFHKLTGEGGRQ
jgi:endonuclease YncB( thermonuclease family)